MATSKSARLTCETALGLWVLLGISTSAPTSAQAGVIKGPHLQDLRSDGITILWEQESAGTGTVTVDNTALPSPSQLIHEVVVNNLSAATTYGYSVQADGETYSGSFTTAPSAPLSPIEFVVMGDNRTDHASHQTMVNALNAEPLFNLLVNTGDMVSSGEVAADWQSFFDIEHTFIANTPWYPVIGNHEEDGGNLPHFFNDYLAPPTATSGKEAYYSFTYANTAFIVLDGHVNVDNLLIYTNFDATQLAWIDSMLAQYSSDPTIQHIFVFNHEPPYSSKDGRAGSRAVRFLFPKFLQYGVDAVISGHDHYLERGESLGTSPGVRYWIMGGGGAPLYDNESVGNLGYKMPTFLGWFEDEHNVSFAMENHGYLLVSVCNGQVDTTVKDAQGNVVDSLSWNTGDVAPGGCEGAGTGGEGGTGGAGTGGAGAVGGSGGAGTGAAAGSGGVTSTSSGTTTSSGSSPGTTEDDSGCGCQVPGRRSSPMPFGLAAVLGLLVGLQGRRQRRHRS